LKCNKQCVNGECQIYKSKEGYGMMLELYQEFLSKCTAPYNEIDVETSFGKTHVVQSGLKNKKNLVLLHGTASNSSTWGAVIPYLIKDFHVFAIDIIDQPGKSKPIKIPKNGKEYADWLKEVFNALNINTASILGNSMGGFIAHWFLYCYPEHVESTVLLSYTYTKKGPSVCRIMIWIYHWIFSTPEEFIELAHGGPIKNEETRKLVLKHFNFVKKYVKLFTYDATAVPEKSVKKINKPVLIILGEKDYIAYNPKEVQEYIKEVNNPFIRFVMVPNQGHMFIEQTDSLKIIPDFLKL
jgi:pimeloyl-ACP methyl ester carboxylesterase